MCISRLQYSPVEPEPITGENLIQVSKHLSNIMFDVSQKLQTMVPYSEYRPTNQLDSGMKAAGLLLAQLIEYCISFISRLKEAATIMPVSTTLLWPAV